MTGFLSEPMIFFYRAVVLYIQNKGKCAYIVGVYCMFFLFFLMPDIHFKSAIVPFSVTFSLGDS